MQLGARNLGLKIHIEIVYILPYVHIANSQMATLGSLKQMLLYSYVYIFLRPWDLGETTEII